MKLSAFLITLLATTLAFAENYTIDLPPRYDDVAVRITVQKGAAAPGALISVTPAGVTSVTLDETPGLIGDLELPAGKRTWLTASGFLTELCPLDRLPACSGETRHFLVPLSNPIKGAADIERYSASSVYGGLSVRITTRDAKISKPAASTVAGLPSNTYFLFSEAQESIGTMAHLLSSLHRRDVIGFFGLGATYNTPLKLKRFKRSGEYKAYRKSLAKARKDIMKTRFCHPVTLSDYGLKRKGFTVESGLRYGDLTLDIRSFRKTRDPKERGFRNFFRASENVAVTLEAAEKVAMCFRPTRLASRVRKVRYKMDPAVLRFMGPDMRRFIRRNPPTTRFEEFRMEASHLVLGGLEHPRQVFKIVKGRVR
jgi:hypothetical protein